MKPNVRSATVESYASVLLHSLFLKAYEGRLLIIRDNILYQRRRVRTEARQLSRRLIR